MRADGRPTELGLGVRLVTALLLLYAFLNSSWLAFVQLGAGLIGRIFVPSEPSKYSSAEEIAKATGKLDRMVVVGVIFALLACLELASAAAILGQRPRLVAVTGALGIAGAGYHGYSSLTSAGHEGDVVWSIAAGACCLAALLVAVVALSRQRAKAARPQVA